MTGGGDTYQFDHITYVQDVKKNMSFSFIQSIILIAAYCAGSNKEQTDINLFQIDKAKYKLKKGGAN